MQGACIKYIVCIKYRANPEIIIPGSFKWHRKHVQGKEIV